MIESVGRVSICFTVLLWFKVMDTFTFISLGPRATQNKTSTILLTLIYNKSMKTPPKRPDILNTIIKSPLAYLGKSVVLPARPLARRIIGSPSFPHLRLNSNCLQLDYSKVGG
jgi:hypothetical protein